MKIKKKSDLNKKNHDFCQPWFVLVLVTAVF